MNAAAPEPAVWSRGRVWSAVFLVIVAQLAVIFWSSERRSAVTRQPGTTTSFSLVADARAGTPLAELLDLDDPTLFALPHARGFSGGAWMKAPTFRHRSEDWTEPPRFFALPVDELGTAFAEFVDTNVVGATVLSDKPAPRLSEVVASPVPLPTRSAIRLADGLAGRAIASAPDVPAIRHTDILAATVVEVSVKPSGFVFSATVFSSSGSKMADQTALDLARAIRFKPIAKTDTVSSDDPVALNWGKIVFQWLTSETPATNNPVTGATP